MLLNREYPAAEVVEINGEIPNEPIIFAGFVGAGLVGPLSIGHMIAEMNMKEIAYVRPLLYKDSWTLLFSI